ncbi:hypothetical protein HK098_005907 [Nowakowskiella sp. JEL0407]|nr:hypothetical protein HK098_005907 [Nowakowskiella sp. JEL0407]
MLRFQFSKLRARITPSILNPLIISHYTFLHALTPASLSQKSTIKLESLRSISTIRNRRKSRRNEKVMSENKPKDRAINRQRNGDFDELRPDFEETERKQNIKPLYKRKDLKEAASKQKKKKLVAEEKSPTVAKASGMKPEAKFSSRQRMQIDSSYEPFGRKLRDEDTMENSRLEKIKPKIKRGFFQKDPSERVFYVVAGEEKFDKKPPTPKKKSPIKKWPKQTFAYQSTPTRPPRDSRDLIFLAQSVRQGRIKRASLSLKEMLDKREFSNLNTDHLNSALELHLQLYESSEFESDLHDTVFQIIEYSDIAPDQSTYEYLLRHYSRIGNTSTVDYLLSSINETEYRLSKQFIAERKLECAVASNNMAQVEHIFPELCAQNPNSDQPYILLLESYVRHHERNDFRDRILNLFNEMLNAPNVKVTASAYEPLLKFYNNQEKYDDSFEVWNRLTSTELELTANLYNLIISAHIGKEQYNDAFYLLQQMSSQKVVYNNKTIELEVQVAGHVKYTPERVFELVNNSIHAVRGKIDYYFAPALMNAFDVSDASSLINVVNLRNLPEKWVPTVLLRSFAARGDLAAIEIAMSKLDLLNTSLAAMTEILQAPFDSLKKLNETNNKTKVNATITTGFRYFKKFCADIYGHKGKITPKKNTKKEYRKVLAMTLLKNVLELNEVKHAMDFLKLVKQYRMKNTVMPFSDYDLECVRRILGDDNPQLNLVLDAMNSGEKK